jgi:flavin reductase (DIM6/NTAB) family NADH-FMN oxidoreductase RutF
MANWNDEMKESDGQKLLAAALGRIPSGLFILTARHGTSETGKLLSWVQQCSFEPPLITLALKRGRSVADWLKESATFVLNILDDSQTDMVGHFGRGFELGEPAFEGLEIERPHGLAPVLREALAYLECRVTARHAAGDHDLLVAEILGGKILNEGHPMVHVRKSGMHY